MFIRTLLAEHRGEPVTRDIVAVGIIMPAVYSKSHAHRKEKKEIGKRYLLC